VRLEEGRLEVAFTPGAPSNLAGELGTKLSDWTGRRWFVTVSRDTGAATLAESAKVKEEAAKRDVRADPVVEAVLRRFPGAEIVAVHRPAASAPVSEADSESPIDPEDER